MPEPPVVYIVEDDPDVARWLAHAVSAEGFRPEIYTGSRPFLAQADRTRLGCIVLDVMLPDISGIEVQEQLAREECPLPVILVSGQATIPLCVSAMQRGAFHFLEKPLDPQEFARILHKAVEAAAESLRRADEQAQSRARLARLSEEDRLLVVLVCEGRINREIAARLDVSVRTVQVRLNRVKKELGVASRLALAQVGTALALKTQ
jgi:FixJ family two-component response regulator